MGWTVARGVKFLLRLSERWFVIGLFVVPLLAWIWPQPGAHGGFLRTDILNQVAVALIFLMSGMCFKREEIIFAAKRWRLNLVILGGSFLLFPLVVYIMSKTLFPTIGLYPPFIIGTLILSCVPITTSTCVILTRIARGDDSTALFNSVVSNFMGAFLAPFLLSYLLNFNGYSLHINPWPIVWQLCYLTVIPMVMGQLICPPLSSWMHSRGNHCPNFHHISEALLLFIIYAAFCNSFIESKNLESPWEQASKLTLAMVILHSVFLVISYLAGLFGFSIAERKAMMFTISQKTVAVGIPLNMAIIASLGLADDEPSLAFYSLPLLVYNNVQWVAAGLLLYFLMRWEDIQDEQAI